MSSYYKRDMSLAGIAVASLSSEYLRSLVRQILGAKIHGISFSPCVEGPGAPLGESQIRERLRFVQPHVHWVRSFSCAKGNELIPKKSPPKLVTRELCAELLR